MFVDEQQHVLILLIAEIFRDGQTRQRHAQTGAGWFVHLAVNEGDFRFREIVLLDDVGLGHFVVKIVALARPLADAGEDRHTAVQFGNVVDQLHDDDGLAHAGAAEGADFAAFKKGTNQINDLDAGGQDLGRGGLIDQGRGGAMNGGNVSRKRRGRARRPGCR